MLAQVRKSGRIASGLAVVWIAAVVYLGLTARRTVVGLGDSLAQPVQHFLSFAVTSALLFIVFPTRRAGTAAALVVAAVAGEFLQLLANDRSFDILDMCMNLCGVAFGTGVVLAGGANASGAIFGTTIALLLAGPFLLKIVEPIQTSFPRNCKPPPASVSGEPIALLDGISNVTGPISDERVIARIADAVMDTSEFSIEAWFETPDVEQTGPARIFTISDGIQKDQVNVHLGVDGSTLSIRFRTKCDLFNSITINDVIEVGQNQHVVVNWSAGVLETWVDGEVVDRTEVPWGTLNNWDADFHMVIGDEVGGRRAFDGQISSISMWDRGLDPETIAERYAQVP